MAIKKHSDYAKENNIEYKVKYIGNVNDFLKKKAYQNSALGKKEIYKENEQNLLNQSNALKNKYTENDIKINKSGLLPTTDKKTYLQDSKPAYYQKTYKELAEENKKHKIATIDKKAEENVQKFENLKNIEEVKKQTKQVEKAYDETANSYYDYLKQKVAEDNIGVVDKTIGMAWEGIKAPLTIGKYSLKNDKGESYIMPTYGDLKQQKILESYETGIGKIAGSALYELGRQGTSLALNTLIPGSGTTAYFGSMFSDNWNNAIKEGYDDKNSLVYASLGTALEVATGKILGGTTKAIFGTGSSNLSNAIGTGLSKLIKNHPKLVNVLSDAIAEGGEEFLQEYIDQVNRKITLDKNNKVFTQETFDNALYSAAVGALTGSVGGIIDTNNSNVPQTNINLPGLNQSTKNLPINSLVQQPTTNTNNLNVNEGVNQFNKPILPDINKQLNINLPLKNYTQNQNNIRLNAEMRTTDNNIQNSQINNISKLKSAEQLNLEKQINNAISDSQSNSKSYLGKVTSYVANKIQKITGIDVQNRRHVLTNNDIRHMLKQHGNQDTEALKGQIAITPLDIENIPDIISNPSDIVKGTNNKQGQTIRYIKRYNNNSTYVVEVVPDKSNALIIKTMWKKPSTLTNSITTPSSTPEAKGSDISSTLIDNNITQLDENVKLSSINNMQENTNNIPLLPNSNNRTLNPLEISKLTQEDANTTPKPPKINRNKINDGNSKFYENIRDKVNMLNEQQKHTIMDNEEVQYYDKITNKESLDKAFEKLDKNGQKETLNWFSKDSENANATDVAMGWILLKQYADNNDADGMVAAAKKLRDIGTKAGQTVQAFNIMERMTPEGMVKYAQSELQEAYEKMVKNKSKEWIDKYRNDFDLTPEEVSFIMETMKEISTMEDGYDKRVKLAEIQKVMTDKLPPAKGAGIKSWMRISMLFNPKTQVRNVMGNATIAPVNYFSDLFSSAIDKQISRYSGYRTIGKTNLSNYAKGFKKGFYESYNDFKKGINTRNIDGNRFEIGEGKSFNNNTTMGKALNRVDNLLSFMLDAGDRTFYEATFTNSINNQMVLNNTTEVTEDMIDIATQEALSRTWQDNNAYTKFVLQTRNALNKINVKGYGLGDVLIPFAKTPANLTKAIIDYSPAGLVNTITSGINLKRSLSNGQYTPQMQHQFVQNLGKATAGTMLYVLGYALAKSGVISGESDEDKDTKDFMKNTLGINSYSIKIRDKSFTYDWAQPIAAPLSIMANYVKKSEENANASKLENLISSLDVAGNILLEQSFMESINTVLSNNDGLATGIQEAILELPSRAVPTFMKQIVDLTDSTQRTSFEYDKPLETMVNKVKAKVPGLSKTLAPVVDTMGREVQRYGGKNNIFNVFLNPANVSTENISESAKEIYNVYKAIGDTTVMPRVAPYSINKDGEKIILNSTQKAEYQKISGNIIEESVSELLKESKYKNLSADEKASIINKIVNYSYNKAREEVLGLEMSNEYNKINEYTSNGGKVSDYYLNKEEIDYSLANPEKYAVIYQITTYDKYNKYKEELKNIRDNSDNKKTDTINYINSLKLSIPQKAMFIRQYYTSFDNYNEQIVEYINKQKLSLNEKTEVLKELGFEIKNGKVYW